MVTQVPDRAPILDSAGQLALSRSAAYTLGVQPDRLSDPRLPRPSSRASPGSMPARFSARYAPRRRTASRSFSSLTRRTTHGCATGSAGSRACGCTVVQRRLFTSEAPRDRRHCRHREREVAASGRGALPAGHDGRAVRVAGGLPAPPRRHADDGGGHRGRARRGRVGAQEVARPATRTGTDDHRRPGSGGGGAGGGHGAGCCGDRRQSRRPPGHILAVSQRAATGQPLSTADVLDGRYPPGDAFTIVSTAALLGTGFAVDTQIPCSGAKDVGGETFTNDQPEQGIGAQPPFRVDFAHTCGTAFVGLSRLLTANQLTTRGDKVRPRRELAASAAGVRRIGPGAGQRRGAGGRHDRPGRACG